MTGVPIRTAMYQDPRFSNPQMKAILAAAEADPNARLLGLDRALRPVVRARLGMPREARTYAIMRNGDPTDVRWEGNGGEGYGGDRALYEPWMETTPC